MIGKLQSIKEYDSIAHDLNDHFSTIHVAENLLMKITWKKSHGEYLHNQIITFFLNPTNEQTILREIIFTSLMIFLEILLYILRFTF